jgi:ATP-dependent RNA helicase DeaD
MDNINPKILLQFFNEKARVDREQVGDIDILEKFTFVDVTEAAADSIIKNCINKRLGARKVRIEVSKPKK